MAQVMIARANVMLYDPSGSTVTTASLRKAYKGGGGYGIVGDAGDGDPSPGIAAASISMTRGDVSEFSADYYTWYCDIAASYTYTLYIDGVASTALVCQMFFSMDLLPAITVNSTHVSGDGSDHADVAANSVHAALVTGNPHAVDTSLANGVNLPNVDNTSDATKNAAIATLTNKTLVKPYIESIYQDGRLGVGTKLFALPTTAGGGDLADKDEDCATKEQLVSELASGTTDSLTVLRYLFSQLVNSEKFASMMTYAGNITTYAGDPTGNVTPSKILQLCFDSTNTDVYIALGLTNADWEEITTS